MKLIPPFIELSGRMWVVIKWTPGLSLEAPLQLRPMHSDEMEWLEKELEDAYFDLFARLFPTDEDCLRGARTVRLRI